ncbi:unnamed protein product [Adineta steineri]|uniref:Uncharacterized protein n=1 Tax=Adineta steineri TaxID=433720 RepID=A0A815MG50_9BILA|nr:unnamed protein product [Adineta steineri]CAF3830892.1 unnamed protein product [Adineta steineri]
MKTGTIWGISLGVGIPGVLILIGIIGLLIKFCMKRCRKKAWDDISSLPKHIESFENSSNRKQPKRQLSEREPLYPSATNNVLEVPDGHIVIPMDENDLPPGQRPNERTKQHEHTLVQIQRDRLNRLKEEETRLRPMIQISGEDDIQRAIDQAQKEFDESVANASSKMKRRRDI